MQPKCQVPQRLYTSLSVFTTSIAKFPTFLPVRRPQRGPGLRDPGSGDGGPGAMFCCSSSSGGRGGGSGSGGGGPGRPSLAGSLLRLLHLLLPRRGSPSGRGAGRGRGRGGNQGRADQPRSLARSLAPSLFSNGGSGGGGGGGASFLRPPLPRAPPCYCACVARGPLQKDNGPWARAARRQPARDPLHPYPEQGGQDAPGQVVHAV